MTEIRVLIAEDHALVREGTRRILEQYDDIQVIGEAEDGPSALKEALRLKPDVILLDIRLPDMSGVEVTRELVRQAPDVSVLILSAFDDDDYVLGLLDAGASGYLLKTVRSAELIDAVRRVQCGETVLHPDIARAVATLWQRHLRPQVGVPELTDKEMHVLRLVCRGLQNKEVARELGVSVRTVEGHMSAIFDRLGVHSRTEAVIHAVSRGWFEDALP